MDTNANEIRSKCRTLSGHLLSWMVRWRFVTLVVVCVGCRRLLCVRDSWDRFRLKIWFWTMESLKWARLGRLRGEFSLPCWLAACQTKTDRAVIGPWVGERCMGAGYGATDEPRVQFWLKTRARDVFFCV